MIPSAWHPSTIAGKLRLCIGLFFLLITCILVSWMWSLRQINQARTTIGLCTAIERTVLDMDRLLEKARRLHGDFCVQYSRIGLAEAHVQFAQPSIRLVAEAVTASTELKKMLDQSEVGKDLSQHRVDLNLYLASAKRFGDTSLQSIDLITRLAAPERGLEATLNRLLPQLSSALAQIPSMVDLNRDLQLSVQRYLTLRQRPLMQAAFNALASLEEQLARRPSLPGTPPLRDLLAELKATGQEMVQVDAEIKNKLNDFNLQNTISQPIARILVDQAAREVQAAKEVIAKIIRNTAILLVGCLAFTVGGGLLISRFITHTITRRIEILNSCANCWQQGQLELKAPEQPTDELGQLGQTFNLMSSRIATTLEHLEKTIAERTSQLSASEQRFRSIADQLPHVAIIGMNSARQVFFWNHACHQLYGLSDNEAHGQLVEELLVDEQQRPLLQQQLMRWIDEDCPLAGEMTFRHREGDQVPVFVASLSLTDPAGCKELYSIQVDLTELKRVEEERALQASIYRSLFEHTSSGVGVLEPIDEGIDFLIKDANPAVGRIERYPLHEIKGKSLVALFPEVVSSGMLAILQKVWRTGTPQYLPPIVSSHDHRTLWRQGHLYTIPSGEVVLVYDDITQLKESEQQRVAIEAQLQRSRKMEAIGLLAGGVAHDLNNILSGIVSYPDLLLMQLAPDSTLRKHVLAIQESGQRAAAVVADLLTVARGVSSEKKICSLNQLIKEYLLSPEHEALLARHPGVRCQTALATSLPPFPCSPIHIKKSLMNLVTNAAEAIDHGGQILIRTRAEQVDESTAQSLGIEPGHYVVIEVKDSGSGIPQADLDHIFEPFYTKKAMGRSGTGLGLAVVWNTIEDHRGSVQVSSSDAGTMFLLHFPAAPRAVLPEHEDSDAGLILGSGQTILIVDDESMQREVAAQFLDTLGYSSQAVSSGEAAVEFLRTQQVDLVLLDMLMGNGINGRQTYERILHDHPGQKALIVSGYSENEEVRDALALGVSAYLQKPYTLEHLSRTVAAILSSSP